MAQAVNMKNIVKRFGPVTANRGVDFSAEKGEVHALVGENGAGKSTLMNILYGLHSPDEGTIEVGGVPVVITNPRVAIKHGIGMVHQHFKLVPSLTVAENIVLGSEPGNGLNFNRNVAFRQVRELSKTHDLHIDPGAMVQDLPVGLRQRVEILKVLYRSVDVLILDEPTAVLTPQETEELFVNIRQLANSGKTVIFITHKLGEVMSVSDRVSIMRDGRIIKVTNTCDTSAEEIASDMVGRPVLFRVKKREAQPKQPILSVSKLVVDGSRGVEAVRGVSFEVRSGEIVGIAGVQGNGQDELIDALVGLRKPKAGKVTLNGHDITSCSPAIARDHGLSYIPADRMRDGLCLPASLWENAIAGHQRRPELSRGPVLNIKECIRFTQELIDKFDIRGGSASTPCKALSGGNQQKLVAAREMSRNGEFIIADQPSRGVDIGAIEFMHNRLIAMRDEGTAILLVSADLDEILSVSDRILVLYKGEVVGEVPGAHASKDAIGRLMAGIRDEGGEQVV